MVFMARANWMPAACEAALAAFCVSSFLVTMREMFRNARRPKMQWNTCG